MNRTGETINPQEIIERADLLRRSLPEAFREDEVQAIYRDAENIFRRAVRQKGDRYGEWDRTLDRLLTSPVTGLPIMAFVLAVVLWITMVGANYPSQMLAGALFGIENKASTLWDAWGAPWWLTGFLWHGIYRGLAWVVSVMLPPMAIFFPLFTILEDFGFLPRVAFNMDRLFQKCGAHGKQALTMGMGFGCNAAGVIATRIIDSPRERLIAILTNTFVPCNGRFPTLIMLANIFVAAAFPPALASFAAAGAVVGVVGIGVIFTLIVSAVLSRTILKGEPSIFVLELPPYRRPHIWRVLYTSIMDRTIFVLYRAVVMAVPAGGLIWLLGNIYVAGESLTSWIAGALQPFGHALGLDGVIILAYIIAVPANEIVVPVILMAYRHAGSMVEMEGLSDLRHLLVGEYHWSLLTAVCLMLFSLLHNPCSTTILTIWKETRSVKWTVVGALMPLGVAVGVTFIVAQTARVLGWG
jgi:ferrous iron transport protein B